MAAGVGRGLQIILHPSHLRVDPFSAKLNYMNRDPNFELTSEAQTFDYSSM